MQERIVLPSFSVEQSSACSLNIHHRADQFSWCVTNRDMECQAFGSLRTKSFGSGGREQLTELFAGEELLQAHYDRITVVIGNRVFTLSPQPVSGPGEAENLLGLSHKMVTSHVFHSGSFQHQSGLIVWGMPTAEHDFFRQRFAAPEFLHSMQILIDTAELPIGTRVIHCNLHHEWFELAAFDNRKLGFCNAFTWRGPEDFLYFCAASYEQTGLDMNADELILTGEVEYDDQVVKLVRKYVRNVKVRDETHGITFGSRFSSVRPHRHHTLFASVIVSRIAA